MILKIVLVQFQVVDELLIEDWNNKTPKHSCGFVASLKKKVAYK